MKNILIATLFAAILVLGAFAYQATVTAQSDDTTSSYATTTTISRVYKPEVANFRRVADDTLYLELVANEYDGDPNATGTERVRTIRTISASSSEVRSFYSDPRYLDCRGNALKAILQAMKDKGDLPADLDINANMRNL